MILINQSFLQFSLMPYQAQLNYRINFDHILIVLIFTVEKFLYVNHRMLVEFAF